MKSSSKFTTTTTSSSSSPSSSSGKSEDNWENIPPGINPELAKIAKGLKKVPKEYRKEDFNPLPKVSKILLRDQESQKEGIADIERLSSQLDECTNIVSDIYWEGFNRSIKSYSSIISHITSAQHNVQDLQGLLYDIEKVHGQESVLKGMFSDDGSSTGSATSDVGNDDGKDDKDGMKITIRKATVASAEEVMSTKESKTKLTNLYSRYLESCETLALYDKIIILRDSEKAEREFEHAGYFLHAAYMSKIGFETHYALERGVQESLCVQNLIFAINNNKLRLNEAICKKLMEHIYYRRGKVTGLDIPSESKDKTGHFKLSKEVMDEDLSRHPETDTGVFMRNCVHALSLIDKLDNAVEDIKRGLRTEIATIFNPLTIAFALKEKNVELLDGREVPEFSKEIKPAAGTTLEAMFDRCVKIINNLSFIGNSIRSFDQGTKFNVKEMWSIMQSEITRILFMFLEDPMANDSSTSMNNSTSLFSFSSSMIINSINETDDKSGKGSSLAASLESSQSKFQQKKQHQQAVIMTEKEALQAIKNPRNITVLNPLLRKFNAEVSAMVGCEDSIEDSKIAVVLKDYIEKFYIKYSTIVLGKRATKIFVQKPTLRNLPPELARRGPGFSSSSSSSNSSSLSYSSSSALASQGGLYDESGVPKSAGSGKSRRRRRIGADGGSGGIGDDDDGGVGHGDDDDESYYIGTKKVLDSVFSVYQIVRMIVKDINAMPRFSDKFIAIMNSILNKFYTYCEAIYNECLPSNSEAVRFLSGKNEKDIADFLHHDPFWVRVGSNAVTRTAPTPLVSAAAAAGTSASNPGMVRDRAKSGATSVMSKASAILNSALGSQNDARSGKRSPGAIFSEAEKLDEIRRFQPSAIISPDNRISLTGLITDVDTTIRLSDLHNSLDWFVYRLYSLVGYTDASGGKEGGLPSDFAHGRGNQRDTFKVYLKRITMYVPTAVSAASAVEGQGGPGSSPRISSSGGGGGRGSLGLSPVQHKGSGRIAIKSLAQSQSPSPSPSLSPAISQQQKAAENAERSLSLAILNFTGMFSKICEQAIFTLRVDLKFQCIYFLSLCRKLNYYCDESEILADNCVIELNHRLAATEKALNLHLQPRRMKFVISGIAPLICDTMINTASSIKRVNNPGIRKLLRNVFAIQQNLGPIVVRKEAFFDRVRQYYEMLYLSDYSELYAHVSQRIADGKPVFNIEQYHTIMDIIYPGRKPDAEFTRQLQTLLLSYI